MSDLTLKEATESRHQVNRHGGAQGSHRDPALVHCGLCEHAPRTFACLDIVPSPTALTSGTVQLTEFAAIASFLASLVSGWIPERRISIWALRFWPGIAQT